MEVGQCAYRLLLALFAVAVVLLCLLSVCAGADDTAGADSRLAKPVTIECTNVRLHTVLERLSDETGVRLNCGRRKDDWQVRDIPVVVCVKDVPLENGPPDYRRRHSPLPVVGEGRKWQELQNLAGQRTHPGADQLPGQEARLG